MKWTHWRPIEEVCSHRNTAVYKIALLERFEPFEPIKIPRFLKEDKDGILVIGETTQMERRRRYFINGSHSEGILWDKLKKYTGFEKKFPNAVLAYCYSIIEDNKQAKSSESRLIKKYIIQYGEAPPLNSSIPDRYNDEEWQNLSQNC
jgi:hypothetical protein